MIKHIVMWKLKEEAEGNNKSENANKIKGLIEGLEGKIKELKFIEVGINFNSSEAAYDVVLNSDFETVNDLDIYQEHPEHIKVKEFIGKVTEGRVVADYEFK